MAYLISEEAQELLGAVKEFCEKEVKEQCKEYDRSGEWPKEIYDKARCSCTCWRCPRSTAAWA